VSQTATIAATLPRRRGRVASLRLLQAMGLAVAVLIIVAAVSTSGFLSWENAKAILASTTFVGMVAVGMTIIMISGSFVSMSLGTTATVTAMFFVFMLKAGVVVAILATLALGGVIGLVQGMAIGAWSANPIILTIAAGAIQEGVTVAISGGRTLSPPSMGYDFLNDTPLGVPLGFFLLLGLVAVVELFMRRTRFGREIFLVGESRAAARAAALPLGAIGGRVFLVAGVSAALAGIMLAAFNHGASLLLNRGTLNYDAIAAALIGGTAISGGRGAPWRALAGAIVIAIVTDLVLLRGYSTGIQILVKGIIVIGFVIALHLRTGERRA
jgi:ribose/xylose/arabinose/galactoside ABC-type transport system permease subunit